MHGSVWCTCDGEYDVTASGSLGKSSLGASRGCLWCWRRALCGVLCSVPGGAKPVAVLSGGRFRAVCVLTVCVSCLSWIVPWGSRGDRRDCVCCCLDSIIPSSFSSLISVNSSKAKAEHQIFPKPWGKRQIWQRRWTCSGSLKKGVRNWRKDWEWNVLLTWGLCSSNHVVKEAVSHVPRRGEVSVVENSLFLAKQHRCDHSCVFWFCTFSVLEKQWSYQLYSLSCLLGLPNHGQTRQMVRECSFNQNREKKKNYY